MDEDLAEDLELETEMPLFKWGTKKGASKLAFKSKLEQKLLMARHDPEPVFDLTDCNLEDVPCGVFSWCKVCLKQQLLLNNNRLKWLKGGGNIRDLFQLTVLELSHNNLAKLPDELGYLDNLQALYLQFNQLKYLPSTFSQLNSLKVLNIKGNCIKTFPPVLGQIVSLIKLDISSNSMDHLPPTLVDLASLTELVIDDNYVTPPAEICKEGLLKIKEFLSQSAGKELVINEPVECSFALQFNLANSQMSHQSLASAQPCQFQEALLANERSLQELYERLSECQLDKQSFLKGVIESQDQMDIKLTNEQNRKDENRHKLLDDLLEVEKESNFLVEELLEFNKLNRSNEALLESLENERKEFIQLFINAQSDTAFTSNRKEILEAMETTLENQYIEACNNLSAYKWAQKEMLAQTQLEELDKASKLHELWGKSGEEQANLVAQLVQDEEYQKRAFAALMMNKDAQYTRISEQISLIENELANLTLLELRRQDLKVQTEKNLLHDQREILTRLLVQLVAQKQNRSQEFENRLKEMESLKSQQSVDFWLQQYQRLLESKPMALIKKEGELDDLIRSALIRANAKHYISQFANKNINLHQFIQMDNQDLYHIGVHDKGIQDAILTEIGHLKRETLSAAKRQSSIRARFEIECVICMERMSSVLYLNCGHVCCCSECAPTVQTCPLCRAHIERIFLLNHLPSAPAQ